METETSEQLTALGFTEYEGKAYLALLESSSATGYAVARRSGVPRSKIYEVLNTLVARGDTLVSLGEPVRYVPKNPEELIASRRKTAEKRFTAAARFLDSFVNGNTPNDLIWDVRGRSEIVGRAREAISRAKSHILLQLWAEDAPDVRDALEAASARGVVMTVVAYGDVDLPSARVYRHEPGAEEITGEYGGRWLILSVDGEEIVTGIVSLGEARRAAWSRHLGLVMPITEQIKHDLYLAELLKKNRAELEKNFGPSLWKLRKKFGPPVTVYRPQENGGDT